jgi:predicted NBD/HSP70 family sugar kinase
VDNDGNLAARAEHRYGGHGELTDLVYLNAHAGIGAGIIADGRPLRGTRGYGGEIGHVRVEQDGPLCSCGRRGCLEAVAGIPALIAKLGTDPDGPPADLEPEVQDILRRAHAGDVRVLKALDEMGGHLGRGVAVLGNVANPQLVVLGGYFVPLAPWLIPAIEAEVAAGVVAPEAGGLRVAASALGHNATATGGAASILDLVDSGRLPVRR